MNQRLVAFAALTAAGMALLAGCSGTQSMRSAAVAHGSESRGTDRDVHVHRALVLPGSMRLMSLAGQAEYMRNDPPFIHDDEPIPDLASANYVELRRQEYLRITSSGRPTGSTRYSARQISRRRTYRDR